jgi:glycosyltransferase involved in cell wall biosynthesis
VRLLLITHRFAPALGGVEAWAEQLAGGLNGLGHEVVVLSRDDGANAPAEAAGSAADRGGAAGPPYGTHDETRGALRIRWVKQQHKDERSFTESWNNPAMRAVAATAIRDFSPDVVHIAHNDGWGVTPFRAADEAGLPVVVTLHDYKWICARGQMVRPGGDRCERTEEDLCVRCIDRQLAAVPARGVLRRLLGARGQSALGERDGLRVVENRPDPGARARALWRRRQRGLMAALGGADRVTSPSQFVADRLAAEGLVREVLVIPNGSGTTATTAPDNGHWPGPKHASSSGRRQATVGAPGPLRIGVFGRPHPTKGLDSLITAFTALPTGSAELHLHGAIASDLADPVPPGVFLGGRYAPSEVAARMATVDLVAIPSLWDENHPMVATEALHARRPLVVSNLGGLPELVVPDVSGWVLPAGDAEAWAEQLALLAADPARVRRAQEALEAPRSAADMAAEFEQLYLELVAPGVRATGAENTPEPPPASGREQPVPEADSDRHAPD